MHKLGLLALAAMIVWLHDAFIVAALLEVGCELRRQLRVSGHGHPSFRCFEQPHSQDAVESVWIHFRFRSVERAILLAPNEGRVGPGWVIATATVSSFHQLLAHVRHAQEEQRCWFFGHSANHALIKAHNGEAIEAFQVFQGFHRPYTGRVAPIAPRWKLRMLEKAAEAHHGKGDKHI